MLRWFGYIVVFFVAAFFLHFVVEAVVSTIAGAVAPNSADEYVGPVTLVLGFALAGVVTWLIHRSGLQIARSEEDQRRGEEVLEQEHRRLEAAEQQRIDEERLQRVMAEVGKWRQARDIRAYASEALAALGADEAAGGEAGTLRDELQWALTYADHIDPLRD